MLGVVGIVANVVLLVSVKFIGKRNIYLWSMIGTFVSCFGLGNSFIYFDSLQLLSLTETELFQVTTAIAICHPIGVLSKIIHQLQMIKSAIFR